MLQSLKIWRLGTSTLDGCCNRLMIGNEEPRMARATHCCSMPGAKAKDALGRGFQEPFVLDDKSGEVKD